MASELQRGKDENLQQYITRLEILSRDHDIARLKIVVRMIEEKLSEATSEVAVAKRDLKKANDTIAYLRQEIEERECGCGGDDYGD